MATGTMAVAIAAGGAMVSSPQAAATAPQEQRASEQGRSAQQLQSVRIRTFANKCLDVARRSHADRAPIIQYRCHNAPNQKFRFERAGRGQYRIKTFANKCLDVERASHADRARIIQYRCTNGANQKFRVERAGRGQYRIKTFANKCLDVERASHADRARIIQYRCTNAANQKFRFQR
ncbi:RICIN domain-containing protein [Streptomyces sp. AJS327]|uniref:RICIN domain-containing protein n=1 Tax=Streptomyces sp. AJS327 TaxID=2545265 RepID=UPI001C60F4DD|nr:RICIN domain-containing protein [Streptomyces sp. AJS327]